MINRKDPNSRRWTLALAVSLLTATSALAGHEIVSAKDVKEVKDAAPVRTWFPDFPPGYITAGVQASQHNTGAFIDSVTGLWSPRERDAFLFLDSRYHYEDNGQFISSTGLGFRQMLANQSVIVGANAFWDRDHSQNGNDFNQLGLGLEVLTKWVDARVNYYLPDNDHYETEGFSRRERFTDFRDGAFGTRSNTLTYHRYEAALEGLNAEVGVLIPGLDKYAEVRVFGGYYHYQNPFGGDFDGFKARLEARVLPGVILDLEYWDDTALMGGHWTAGARVSVPFSLYNLVSGRNPFEGIGEQFTPRSREFKERLGEMVMRSHRIQTTTSGPELTSRRSQFEPSSRGGGTFGGGSGGGEPFPPE